MLNTSRKRQHPRRKTKTVGESLTVPDMSISLRTLVEKYVKQGGAIPELERIAYYDDDADNGAVPIHIGDTDLVDGLEASQKIQYANEVLQTANAKRQKIKEDARRKQEEEDRRDLAEYRKNKKIHEENKSKTQISNQETS